MKKALFPKNNKSRILALSLVFVHLFMTVFVSVSWAYKVEEILPDPTILYREKKIQNDMEIQEDELLTAQFKFPATQGELEFLDGEEIPLPEPLYANFKKSIDVLATYDDDDDEFVIGQLDINKKGEIIFSFTGAGKINARLGKARAAAVEAAVETEDPDDPDFSGGTADVVIKEIVDVVIKVPCYIDAGRLGDADENGNWEIQIKSGGKKISIVVVGSSEPAPPEPDVQDPDVPDPEEPDLDLPDPDQPDPDLSAAEKKNSADNADEDYVIMALDMSEGFFGAVSRDVVDPRFPLSKKSGLYYKNSNNVYTPVPENATLPENASLAFYYNFMMNRDQLNSVLSEMQNGGANKLDLFFDFPDEFKALDTTSWILYMEGGKYAGKSFAELNVTKGVATVTFVGNFWDDRNGQLFTVGDELFGWLYIECALNVKMFEDGESREVVFENDIEYTINLSKDASTHSLNKTGKYNDKTGRIEWEIIFDPGSLMDWPLVFSDILSDNEIFVDGSLKVERKTGAQWQTVANAPGNYEFALTALGFDVTMKQPAAGDADKPIRITYQTVLADSEYYVNKYESSTVINEIRVYKHSNMSDPLDSIRYPVEIPANKKQWIAKNYELTSSGDIKWTVTVNTNSRNLKDLVLHDLMDQGMTPIWDTLTITSASGTFPYSNRILFDSKFALNINPDDCTFEVTFKNGVPLDQTYVITYNTKVDYSYYSDVLASTEANKATAENKAWLTYGWYEYGGDGHIGNAGGEPGDLGIPEVTIEGQFPITMIAKTVSYSHQTRTFTWTVTVNPNHLDLAGGIVTDDLTDWYWRYGLYKAMALVPDSLHLARKIDINGVITEHRKVDMNGNVTNPGIPWQILNPVYAQGDFAGVAKTVEVEPGIIMDRIDSFQFDVGDIGTNTLVFTFETKPDIEYSAAQNYALFGNTARFTGTLKTGETVNDEHGANYGLGVENVRKQVSYFGYNYLDNNIPYDIKVNPYGAEMTNAVLRDVLPAGTSYDPTYGIAICDSGWSRKVFVPESDIHYDPVTRVLEINLRDLVNYGGRDMNANCGDRVLDMHNNPLTTVSIVIR